MDIKKLLSCKSSIHNKPSLFLLLKPKFNSNIIVLYLGR